MCSQSSELQYGVPQGSVLGGGCGGILFTLYTTLIIGDIARHYGLSVHLYADDMQVYATFQVSQLTIFSTDLYAVASTMPC